MEVDGPAGSKRRRADDGAVEIDEVATVGGDQPKRVHSTAIVAAPGGARTAIIAAPPPMAPPPSHGEGRTSSLEAPILLLTGHAAPVYCVKFSPDGRHLATAGKDKQILLWNVYGESDNYGTLAGHKNAVLDIAWSADGTRLYSVSADRAGAIWDAETGAKMRTLSGAGKIVNACSVASSPAGGGAELVAVGGDDGTLRVYDGRSRAPAHTLPTGLPILALALSADAGSVWVGGIDPCVRQWELRRGAPLLQLAGHAEPVTGLALSTDGTRLLSAGMDHTGAACVGWIAACSECIPTHPLICLQSARGTPGPSSTAATPSAPSAPSLARATRSSSHCCAARGRRTASVPPQALLIASRTCGTTRAAPSSTRSRDTRVRKGRGERKGWAYGHRPPACLLQASCTRSRGTPPSPSSRRRRPTRRSSWARSSPRSSGIVLQGSQTHQRCSRRRRVP